MRYIILNCPVCYDDIKMCGKTLKLDPYTKESTWINCQDCTDCLLKQIVEMCKQPNEPYYNSECEYGIGRIDMGKDILELLEIQECE